MTLAEACVRARALLVAAEAAGVTEIEIPWHVYYALHDLDPATINKSNQWNRFFGPDLLRDKLDRMEGKVVARVTGP